MRLPQFVIDLLIAKTMQLVARRPEPDVIIGGKDNPYMLRWNVLPRNKWFNIYFHIFARSDDDRALHDHPWWSCSIILENGYWEHLPRVWENVVSGETTMDYWGTDKVWRPEGSVTFRRAKAAHRVELETDHITGDAQTAMTLFITGPRIREWGFYCPQGWRHWHDFTSYKTGGGKGEIGPGCD